MSTVSSAFTTPEVNGTFNSWCGACWTMTDSNGDNIWDATGRVLKGTTHEFKFSADNWSIQENLFSGLPCVISQWGYTNRTLNVTGDTTLPVVCWESCGPCSSGPSSYNVTFQVDMNYVTDPFSTPEVNGTFNGWCGNCFSMSDADGDNIWDFTTLLGIGSYEYKFSADNWNIAEDLDSSLACVTAVTDSTGTFVNRTLVVSNADIVLTIVYWNGCSTAPVSGCTDPSAVNFNPTAVIDDGSCNYSSYTITTSGLAFVPDTITCDVGDTIFFVNGPSHNAVEVSEATFLSGGTSALSGGFNFGFGASGYFIPSAPTTHYYVCQPHVWAGMVGVIIVNPPPAALALQGIMDFTVPSGGSDGKAIHLVATDNISDLSVYGIGVANNGGGTDGQEYTFDPISVSSGDDILVVRSVSAMSSYFDSCYSNFDHVLLGTSSISQNGDDAIELFYYGSVIETFGDINVDGTGTPWEYMDSWAYKDASGSVGFSGGNWIFGGVNCTDGSTTTYSSGCPYPLCPVPPPVLTITTTVCDTSASEVRLTGPWWSWDPMGGPVAADNGDGTWTFTFNPAPTADMEYLLVVDGVQEDMVTSGTNSGNWSCTPITDYYSYANRLWTVGSGDVTGIVYGTCDSCAVAPPPVLTITTTVCDTSASEVRLTGPWWSWDPMGGPVAADNGDGTWTFTFNPAPTADMEYLLVVDGVQEDMVASGNASGNWSCTPITDYWSYANRLWTVGSGDVTGIVYGTCDSCAVAPPPVSSTSLISDCGDFVSGPAAWPYVLVATTTAAGASSQGAQTFTMNITNLPAGGANVRVAKDCQW